MTAVTAPAPARSRAGDPARAHARAGGIAYLVTFAASVPALLLITPVLDDPGWVTGTGSDTRILVGSLLDLVNALACVATAVALLPVLRRRGEALAVGFVTTRLVEAAVIMTGVVSLIAVVSLHRGVAAGTAGDPAVVTAVAQGLVAVRDATFQFGPNMCAALNALLLGTLLYRARLVPRWMPLTGLVGAPLLLAATVATVLGVTEQGSVWFVGAVPIAVWELSLGIWLVVRGLAPDTDATA